MRIRRMMGDGEDLNYEPNRKHRSTKKGEISPELTNPESVLKNSVQIKGTSTRRIGVDPETNEFVVFDETYPGKNIFHGHARQWNELTQEMRNILIKNGLVNSNGKTK